MKSWKRAEKQAASLLGGQRAGGTRNDLPDVMHERFAVEMKWSKNFPRWITDILEEAKVKAPGKIPLGFLKPKRSRVGIVIVDAEDFANLISYKVNRNSEATSKNELHI